MANTERRALTFNELRLRGVGYVAIIAALIFAATGLIQLVAMRAIDELVFYHGVYPWSAPTDWWCVVRILNAVGHLYLYLAGALLMIGVFCLCNAHLTKVMALLINIALLLATIFLVLFFRPQSTVAECVEEIIWYVTSRLAYGEYSGVMTMIIGPFLLVVHTAVCIGIYRWRVSPKRAESRREPWEDCRDRDGRSN